MASNLPLREFILSKAAPKEMLPPRELPFERCPHCKGNLVVEKWSHHWDVTCLQAGHTVASWRPGDAEWTTFPSPHERSKGTMFERLPGITEVSYHDIDWIFAPVEMQSLEELQKAELEFVEDPEDA